MKMRMKILYIFTLTAIIGCFQNCNQVHFASRMPNAENSKSDNNGTGYGGKPKGQFYRFNPDFTCENKSASVSNIQVTSDQILYTENQKLQCGAIKQNLDPSLIDTSIYQHDIIGYKEGIFEGLQTTPQSIPANLVEVWCRTSEDTNGIETITHFDRTNEKADTEIYYTDTSGPVKQTLVVSRVASAQKVTVSDGAGFLLEVYRDKPAAEFGLFQGKLDAVIEGGKKVSLPTSCRLGGSVDPQFWPAVQIVDSTVELLKVANDLSFFGYTATIGASPARLYTSDMLGQTQKPVTPPMLLTGVKNFEISPDQKSLVYWGDPRYRGGLELFRVNTDGTNQFQLNEPITNSQQGVETDIEFSPDGTQVLYRDGQQETGPEGGADIEMWLRSVPLTGGAPTVINAPLPLTGDMSVYNFAISKSQNKVAYLVGGISAELLISDLDGKNSFKPLPGATFNWYQTINVPPPGDYLFIQSPGVSAGTTINFTTQAVAFNGSGSVTFPTNWELKSLSSLGSSALIYDPRNPVTVGTKKIFSMKAVNLKNGTSVDLPKSENAFFSKDGSDVISVRFDGSGNAQAVLTSLASQSEIALCPEAKGSEIFIKEIDKKIYFISAFNSTNKILSFFIRNETGCMKKNSIPVTTPNVQDIVISPDQKKLLVKASLNVGGKAHEQIYYIPVSGEAPLAVNQAVYVGAKINSFLFLKDSKTVLFLGDQLFPGKGGVFLWKSP